jgi:hypothetical protein
MATNIHNEPWQPTPLERSRVFLSSSSRRGCTLRLPWNIRTSPYVILPAVALMGLLVAVYIFQPVSFRARVGSVCVGDTKSQVLAALGQPTARVSESAIFSLSFPRQEDWCYGRRYRCGFAFSRQFPYLFYIQDRSWSFGPWPRDTVVEFDTAGRVSHVQIPKS